MVVATLLAAILVVVVVAVGAVSAPAALASPGRYRPPVDAAIVDHFRPPACRWCPGNRGIDYGVVPGTIVRAVGDGVVSFAGQVGGTLHVTVRHASGLRTTVSFLAVVEVRAGQHVRRGERLGTCGATLHLGVRLGDVYLDPEKLFGGELERARLVPVAGATSPVGATAGSSPDEVTVPAGALVVARLALEAVRRGTGR